MSNLAEETQKEIDKIKYDCQVDFHYIRHYATQMKKFYDDDESFTVGLNLLHGIFSKIEIAILNLKELDI